MLLDMKCGSTLLKQCVRMYPCAYFQKSIKWHGAVVYSEVTDTISK